MQSWSFPTPYGLFSRIQIHHDRFGQFNAAAAKIAAAFQAHPSARPWAAYSTVVGPALFVYTFMPLRQLRELDDMPPLDTIMADVYGPEGLTELRLFRESVVAMDASVLITVDGNLPPVVTAPRPPDYLYYASIELRESLARQFFATARALAAEQHDTSIFAYRTFAGRSRVHFFAGGDSIADLERASSIETAVEQTHGKEAGERIMAELRQGISAMESSILRYMSHGNG